MYDVPNVGPDFGCDGGFGGWPRLFLGEVDHGLARAGLLDTAEGCQQLDFLAYGGACEIGGLLRRAPADCGEAGGAFVEILDGDAERLGEFVEPASGDPVAAVFVLLDLLEGHADTLGQFRLGHVEFDPSRQYPVADDTVDVCWIARFHRCLPPRAPLAGC